MTPDIPRITPIRLTGRAPVAVTIVATPGDDDARQIASAILGTPDVTSSAIDTPREDSAELALEVAERLQESVDDGMDGDTAIVVGADTDLLEFSLVLERLLEERVDGRPPIVLRDLIALASLGEIDRFFPPPSSPTGSETSIGTGPGAATETRAATGTGAATSGVASAPDAAGASEPDFAAAELLANRLEMATVIVVTDLNDSTPARAERAVSLLALLNPNARIVSSSAYLRGRPPARRLLPRLAHRQAASSGWQNALATVDDAHPMSDDGRTVVFRDPRPFHPERLARVLTHDLASPLVGYIQRSKGLFRLASRPDRVGAWSAVGDALSLDPTSMMSFDAHSPAGQELVFIGEALDQAALAAALSDALLSTDELLAGPTAWGNYADPFPAWHIEHEH